MLKSGFCAGAAGVAAGAAAAGAGVATVCGFSVAFASVFLFCAVAERASKATELNRRIVCFDFIFCNLL